MSAEALGTVASATQLAAYSIRIALFLNDVYSKVQNAPRQIAAHVCQIEQLIKITTQIEQHESFQSPIIYSQLQVTLSEAQSLYVILQRLAGRCTGGLLQKYWTALAGEREISTSLERLEKEKATLGLCVSLVQTNLLLNIQGRQGELTSNKMSKQPTYCPPITSTTTTAASSSAQMPPSDTVYRVIGGQKIPVRSQSCGGKEKEPQNGTELSSSEVTEEDARACDYNRSLGHHYGTVRSEDSATLHVGDQNSGEVVVAWALRQRYDSVTASHQSKMLAGNMNGAKAIETFWRESK